MAVENKTKKQKTEDAVHDEVQDYYGKTLAKTEDLKTDACVVKNKFPAYVRAGLGLIHPEVTSKYYGCGVTIPEEPEGIKVLDLGSGSGRDVYLLSYLVGEKGQVVGVDMTDAQIEVAQKHVAYHTEKFGYSKPNVEFKKGYIEKLDELGFEDNYFDVVISNCVINLCLEKEKVFQEIFRVLKPGGELYFSDVYSDRRIPPEYRKDQVLWGECLSGALYWNDFINMAKKTGFADPRLVVDSVIDINNKKVKELIGHITFYSATYRLFKIDGLEPQCEDYGQAVLYKGTIAEHKQSFDLDDHHNFPVGKVMPVCGNTLLMLQKTRFEKHFDFFGTWDTHYGIYADCGTAAPFSSSPNDSTSSDSGSGGCC